MSVAPAADLPHLRAGQRSQNVVLRPTNRQPPGGEGHLAVLQVEARRREQVVIAGVVVVHVRDDDVLDACSVHARCLESLGYRRDDFTERPCACQSSCSSKACLATRKESTAAGTPQ